MKRKIVLIILGVLIATVALFLVVYLTKAKNNSTTADKFDLRGIKLTLKKEDIKAMNEVRYTIKLTNKTNSDLRDVNAFLKIPLKCMGQLNYDYNLISLPLKNYDPFKTIIKRGETVSLFASADNIKKYLIPGTDVDYDNPDINLYGYCKNKDNKESNFSSEGGLKYYK